MNENSRKILCLFIKEGIRPSDFIKSCRKNNMEPSCTISSMQDSCMPGLFNGCERNKSNSDLISLIEKDISVKKYDIINIFEDTYPQILKEIYFPPPLIFYKGAMSFTNLKTCIAIVGTRKCTAYGRDVASYFARELSRAGITIVSGMAAGIDYFAHLSSLDEKGGTVAVLGSGIDIIYPPENKKIYNDIAEKGIVISEFLPGAPPLKINFPARNRIISGLCQGVIVIEAGNKSGSLITADCALQQDREVFAVPGEIYNKLSSGCHKLIKNGAKLAESIDDIFEEITGLDKNFSNGAFSKILSNDNEGFFAYKDVCGQGKDLSSCQRRIYDVIGKKPVSLEEIIFKSETGLKESLRIISELALMGLIKEKNINQYCRIC